MAKYKKRKDGRYSGHVHIKYDDDGKQIFTPMFYAHSIPELEQKKADIKAALNQGTYADDKGKTLGIYADEWLEVYKKDKELGTFKNYANIINNHIDLIKDIRLKDLIKTDIQKQINARSGQLETQRMIKITLNQIIECAIDDGLVYKNVCRRVGKVKQKKSSKRALYSSEKNAIEKCEFTLHEKIFVDILMYTGVRREELLALTKNDINFRTNEVIIDKALAWDGNRPYIKTTKTDNSDRNIPMPNALIETLKSYIDSIDSLYLFTRQNELLTESRYRKIWEGIYNKINGIMGGTPDRRTNKKRIKGINAISGLTPYTFRHNYATMLYYAGVDVKEAQRLLGHADIKTTLEIYTHLDKEKSNAVGKLNEFIAL